MNGTAVDRQLSNYLEYFSEDKGAYDPSPKSSSVRAHALDNRPPGHDRPFFTSRYENELKKQCHRIKKRKDTSTTSQTSQVSTKRLSSSEEELNRKGVHHSKKSNRRTRPTDYDHGVVLNQTDVPTSREGSRNRHKHSKHRSSDKVRELRNGSCKPKTSEEVNPRYIGNGNTDRCSSIQDRKPINNDNEVNKHTANGSTLSSGKINRSGNSRNDCKINETTLNEDPGEKHSNHFLNRDKQGNYNGMVSLDRRISVDSFSNSRKPNRGHAIDVEMATSPHSVEREGKKGGHKSNNREPKRTTLKRTESFCGINPNQRRRCLVCMLVIAVVFTAGLVAAGLVIYTRMGGSEEETKLYDMVKTHVRLRIVNKEFIPSLGDPGSDDFSYLAANFCKEIDIIYLTSTVNMDYFGCDMKTARAGSIHIYYVAPFLDNQHTANISFHEEILTTGRHHVSSTVSEKDGVTSGLPNDTVMYSEFLVDVNSIDIYLEKYSTDRLPLRPNMPSIPTAGKESSSDSTTHMQLNKSTQLYIDSAGTTMTSVIISGNKSREASAESALKTSVEVKHGSVAVDTTDETVFQEATPPLKHSVDKTGQKATTLERRPDSTNSFEVFDVSTVSWPLDEPISPVGITSTATPLESKQTVVRVLGDDVRIGEAASISCHVFTKDDIEDLNFTKNDGNGRTSIVKSFTGAQLKTLSSGEVRTQENILINIYTLESTIVVNLNLSAVSCQNIGEYECTVKLVTGSETSAHGRLIAKEPPGQPVLTLPDPLVENRELIRPITCTGNVGFPPGHIQWLIKPRGATRFFPIEGDFVSTSGPCNNFVTNSLIYTPTRDGNGTLLKCSVVNEHVPSVADLTAVREVQILPDNLCEDVPNDQTIRHPFTCTKFIRCHGKDYEVHTCDNQMCFDEQSGKCGQISLTMPTVNAILNDGVALIKCYLVHNGAWNTMSISKLSTSGDKITILTAKKGVREVTVHQTSMSGRVHTFVDESKLYQVDVNLWVELTCADEGRYICDVDAPFHVAGAVGNIIVQAQPGAPKLAIPNEIVENLPMRQNISCEADVGYPHGTLVLKMKRPIDADFITVPQQTTIDEKRNCSQIVTTSFEYVPKLEDNGMLIRCELENNATLPFDHKFVAVEKMHVIPANFCQIAGDQTMREHPYDCHQYVSCLDGYIYVQRCGSSHCFDPWTLRCDREVMTETEFDPRRPCEPDKNGVFFRHPVLCNKFYWCVQGREVIKHCPLGTLYLDGGQCTFEPERAMCYTDTTDV